MGERLDLTTGRPGHGGVDEVGEGRDRGEAHAQRLLGDVAGDGDTPEHDRPAVGVRLDEREAGVQSGVQALLEVIDAEDALGHGQLEPLAGPAHAGEVDPLLGAEVVVDDGAGDARGLGDALDRRAVVAVLGEQDLGHVQELLDPRRPRHAATGWPGRSAGWHRWSSRHVPQIPDVPTDQDLDGYTTVGYGCTTYK
jgi:hypothetical protein